MASINFSFLEKDWPLLSELGELAERNLYSDPNTTLIKLRMFGEQIADYIFAAEDLEDPEDTRQFIKLKILEEEEVLKEEILELFHSLRKSGNQAVHDSAGSSKEAQELLAAAYKLGCWFRQTYGEGDFKPEKFELPTEEEWRLINEDRNFITTDPLGTKGKKAEKKVWGAVRKAFRDSECLAYWRYPIFANRGEDKEEPDILVIDRELGLIVLEVNSVKIDQLTAIKGDTWEYNNFFRDYDSPTVKAEDQLFALLGYCDSERELRRKVTARSIVAVPNITRQEWEGSDLPKPEDVGLILFAGQLKSRTLLQEIKDKEPVVSGPTFNEQRWKTLISVLTGTVIYREQDSRDNKAPGSRQGVKKVIKEQLHKIDLKQEEIGKSIPPGPQRIRGIAGSGKSVLLCQKAVHMHLKNPDWKIALVFFTRSLYDITIQQLDKWMKRFTNGEQGYDPAENENLQVLHAWGSREQAGFYREICKHHKIRPLSAGDNRLGKRAPNQKLIKAVQILLQEADKIEPIFDAVLIDEAQDLIADDEEVKYKDKQPFFWLAYKSLREIPDNNKKRLIWAYDEAQSLNSLSIPTAPELFGDDPEFKRMVSGFHEGGIRKSEVMYKCYRTPGPILVAAHAIGMGLLRKKGMLRGFTTQEDWQNIGYQVKKGSFRPGNKIVLHRPPETTPNRVPKVWDGEIINFNTYNSRREELRALADNIKQNINQEGLNPSRDILVIALGRRREGFKLKIDTARFLKKGGIDIYIPKAIKKNELYPNYPDIAPNKFWHQGAVTVANIYRAKGNEAYMVYVIGLDKIAEEEADVGLRNQLFVALTRAKGWVHISGTGDYPLYQEFKEVIDSGNTFEFKFQRPAPER